MKRFLFVKTIMLHLHHENDYNKAIHNSELRWLLRR
jgi:hypothetical protein